MVFSESVRVFVGDERRSILRHLPLSRNLLFLEDRFRLSSYLGLEAERNRAWNRSSTVT